MGTHKLFGNHKVVHTVSMRNEIAEEDLLDDIEFEPATEEQAIKASLQDSIDELTANGKQRRKECE